MAEIHSDQLPVTRIIVSACRADCKNCKLSTKRGGGDFFPSKQSNPILLTVLLILWGDGL